MKNASRKETFTDSFAPVPSKTPAAKYQNIGADSALHRGPLPVSTWWTETESGKSPTPQPNTCMYTLQGEFVCGKSIEGKISTVHKVGQHELDKKRLMEAALGVLDPRIGRQYAELYGVPMECAAYT